MKTIDIVFPNIGNNQKTLVSSVYIKVGDDVKIDDSLITIEAGNSSMNIPSIIQGKILDILVKPGDTINRGDLIARVDSDSVDITSNQDEINFSVDVVVLGSGPGGYTAAFRSSDLGLTVILIEKFDSIGGVCLNVGCIPSKTLLHATKVINDVKEIESFGIKYSEPQIDLCKLNNFKNQVISKLSSGLESLASQRKVHIVKGFATFISSNLIQVITKDNKKLKIQYKNVIIATGSRPNNILDNLKYDDRIVNSTGILNIKDIPKDLLIIGAGIIGLEMAEVYSTLGSNVTIVEASDRILPGLDADVVKVLEQRLKFKIKTILTKTKCLNIENLEDGVYVKLDTQDNLYRFDKILVATGRTPNSDKLDLHNIGVEIDNKGFIPIDKNCRTNVANVYAIGDVVGNPMLAHKATHQGKIAAENCANLSSFFDKKVIPFVSYTDPEVAWVGLNETEARRQNIAVNIGKFPWVALGRAIGSGRDEGFTKIIADKNTNKILGAEIIGINAGELISEITLAIEMGANVEDISLTVHPHPTLSESIGLSCEIIDGSITDLYIKR